MLNFHPLAADFPHRARMIPISKILLLVRHFFVQAARSDLRQALRWLLKELAFYRVAVRSKLRSLGSRSHQITPPPPPRQSVGAKFRENLENSDGQHAPKDFIRALYCFFGRALKWFLEHLASYRAALCLGATDSNPNPRFVPVLPTFLPKETSIGNENGSLKGRRTFQQALNCDDYYNSILNGEVVSLEDVLLSFYPHSGDGIHSTTRSIKNHEASRSAHASTISLRSRESLHSVRHSSGMSTRSQHPESNYSGSDYSGSHIDVSVIPPQNFSARHTNDLFIENTGGTSLDGPPYLTHQDIKSRQSDHALNEMSRKSLASSRPPSGQSVRSQSAGSNHSNSVINVDIIAPQDSPSDTVVSSDDTHVDQSQYLQIVSTTPRSLLSSMSGSLFINKSLVHSSEGSDSTFIGNIDIENQGSVQYYERNLHSGDLSEIKPDVFNSGYPIDSGHWAKSLELQNGHRIDDSTHSLSYLSEKSLDEDSSLSKSHPVLGVTSITPIMPEGVLRYADRPIISKTGPQVPMKILPLTKRYDKSIPPMGWEKCIHPEGACYFFNPTKRVYAEADLHDETVYAQLMQDIATIENFVAFNNISNEIDNADTELVIYLAKDSAKKMSTSCYYYVDHKNRSIFFLDIYMPSSLSAWHQIYAGASSQSHLRHEIEAQYWFHCQFFPHSSNLTKEKVQELRDLVLHYIGDTMTSPKCSNSPYPLEELRGILGLANDMDKNLDGISVGTHSCFARLMYILTRAKFLHFHGEPHARIDRTTSVYGQDIYRRTWLVKFLSPFLFFAPDFHLKELQGMYVDETLHKYVFRETMDRMNGDWDRIILYATVMLNANVAVLAIQSVDSIGTSARSATQIASYVSMISSVGSIVIGLLLTRQNRTKFRETVDEFEQYLSVRTDSTHGMEIMAILFSLPYVSLIWGMVSFSLAVIFMCFLRSDIPTAAIVGVSGFISVLFCLLCVHTNWEQE